MGLGKGKNIVFPTKTAIPGFMYEPCCRLFMYLYLCPSNAEFLFFGSESMMYVTYWPSSLVIDHSKVRKGAMSSPFLLTSLCWMIGLSHSHLETLNTDAKNCWNQVSTIGRADKDRWMKCAPHSSKHIQLVSFLILGTYLEHKIQKYVRPVSGRNCGLTMT